MTPEQSKLAYIVFFTCFSVWLVLILSVSFLESGETTPAIFPNYMLALFIGSAVMSSIPAMLIGLNYLGIDFKIWKGKQNSHDALPSAARKSNPSPRPIFSTDSEKESETKKSWSHEANEKNNSLCNSTGEDWSLTEQKAVTNNASVIITDNSESSVKSKDERKAFFLFGETEFNGCLFKPGYLKSLPKNKPIPDDCFGCPQILECIALSGNR